MNKSPLSKETKQSLSIGDARDDIDSSEQRKSNNSEASSSASLKAAKQPAGLILKGGRVRLPDKLMEYLNKEVAPEALYWMPDGDAFALDTEKAQELFLDKYFSGTKLASFLRSISRWGFKRLFFHSLERQVFAFHHPLFKRSNPNLEKEMKMIVTAPSAKAKKSRKGKKAPQTNEATNEAAPTVSTSLNAVAVGPQLSAAATNSLLSPTVNSLLQQNAMTSPQLLQNTVPDASQQQLAQLMRSGSHIAAIAPAANSQVPQAFATTSSSSILRHFAATAPQVNAQVNSLPPTLPSLQLPASSSQSQQQQQATPALQRLLQQELLILMLQNSRHRSS